jgi:hypothetical protein
MTIATETRQNGSGSPRLSITREPGVYGPHSEFSFFSDLFRHKRRDDDPRIEERLKRSQQELRNAPPAIERRSYAGPYSMEYRAPSLLPGSGLYGTMPAWMVQFFATYPRPERALSAVIPSFDLDPKPGIYSINVPRLTSGAAGANLPSYQPNTPVPSQDIADALVTSPVLPIVGQVNVPLQMLEQSPTSPQGAHLDAVLLKDLVDAIDSTIEQKVISGIGLSGTAPYGDLHGVSWQNSDLLGVTNVPGISSLTYTSASPTLPGLYPYLGQLGAQIANLRRRKPEIFLMNFSRWSWIGVSLDSQNRPIVVPSMDVAPEADIQNALSEPTGEILGVPVVTSEWIPTTSGQDTILALRPSDLLLFESQPDTAVFTEVLSGTLEARIQAKAYVGFISARYPTGIASLTGTGLTRAGGF